MATAKLLFEAKYLARIKHPNIIGFHGLVSSGRAHEKNCYDNLGVVTDRIAESLEERIQKWNLHPLSSARMESASVIRVKTEYMLQIAEAISYLHSRRMAVRNISPKTIGFDDNNVIKIINLNSLLELPGKDLEYLQEGLKADVRDWAMAFFELLAQKPAALHFAAAVDVDSEAGLDQEQCPSLTECGYLPFNVQDLLVNACSEDIEDRLDIDEVVQRLEWILYGFEATKEDAVFSFSASILDSNDLNSSEDSFELAVGLDLDTDLDLDLDVNSDSLCSGLNTSSYLPCHLQLLDTVVESNGPSHPKLGCQHSFHLNICSNTTGLQHAHGLGSGDFVSGTARCA